MVISVDIKIPHKLAELGGESGCRFESDGGPLLSETSHLLPLFVCCTWAQIER